MTLTCSVYLMNYLCSPCWKDLSKNYIIQLYSTKNTSYSVIWLYFQWQSLIPSSRTSRNALESIIHDASNFLIVHLTALKPIMGHLYNNTTSLTRHVRYTHDIFASSSFFVLKHALLAEGS